MRKSIILTALLAAIIVLPYSGRGSTTIDEEKYTLPILVNYFEVKDEIIYPKDCSDQGIEGQVIIRLYVGLLKNAILYNIAAKIQSKSSFNINNV